MYILLGGPWDLIFEGEGVIRMACLLCVMYIHCAMMARQIASFPFSTDHSSPCSSNLFITRSVMHEPMIDEAMMAMTFAQDVVSASQIFAFIHGGSALYCLQLGFSIQFEQWPFVDQIC